MLTDPRLRFLGEAEVQEFITEFDLLHVDFVDGDQIITVNKAADYNRVLFNIAKGEYADIEVLYLTSLVVALRYVDGTVHNACVNMSIFKTREEATKDIRGLFEYMKSRENLQLGYYDIVINNESRGSINLDQFDNSELTDYDIVAWRVEPCRIVR